MLREHNKRKKSTGRIVMDGEGDEGKKKGTGQRFNYLRSFYFWANGKLIKARNNETRARLIDGICLGMDTSADVGEGVIS